MISIRVREKEQLRQRIDDLLSTMVHINMVKPKLYHKLLPHIQAMLRELDPSWKRWFKDHMGWNR